METAIRLRKGKILIRHECQSERCCTVNRAELVCRNHLSQLQKCLQLASMHVRDGPMSATLCTAWLCSVKDLTRLLHPLVCQTVLGVGLRPQLPFVNLVFP